MAAGYRRRLLRGSRVREESTGGGGYVEAGSLRRLLCGSRVHEEAAKWQQGTGGGCHVEAG